MTKPILIFDGACNFCRRWILRWQQSTGDRVDYAPFQEVGGRYPQISKEQFESSVQLMEPDGGHYRGVEAVFRTLANAPRKRWMIGVYRTIPGVRLITEWFYRLVASHRVFFSHVTRFLWGNQLQIPTFQFSTWLFLRALGLIYGIAFASLGVQILGLVGSSGILPITNYLQAIQNQLGVERFWMFPTLTWLNGSDAMLIGLSLGGVFLSILLFLGVFPVVTSALAWVFYLSLFHAGQVFLSFQWDILLLETGFLAIFLASFHIAPKNPRSLKSSPVIRWLFMWLLFRLMFGSGIVKLLSGDSTWWGLSALNVHYETQPLPTWIGWYVHQLPMWFQKTSVFLMFIIELIMPFLIFTPRRLRLFSCFSMIAFQGLIMITGNYCFFNWLAIALCLFLIDDGAWSKWIKAASSPQKTSEDSTVKKVRGWPGWITVPILVLILLLSSVQLFRTARVRIGWPQSVVTVRKWARPFHLVNGYGLFAVMTTSRREIVIEGSQDGVHWDAYEFHWKPGDVQKRPPFVAPHQPRLDWQMWFAALSSFQRNPWFVNLMVRMIQGDESVLSLLKHNPFPDNPPQQVRAVLYDYRFTDLETKKASGAWWKRKEISRYSPTFKKEGSQIVFV